MSGLLSAYRETRVDSFVKTADKLPFLAVKNASCDVDQESGERKRMRHVGMVCDVFETCVLRLWEVKIPICMLIMDNFWWGNNFFYNSCLVTHVISTVLNHVVCTLALKWTLADSDSLLEHFCREKPFTNPNFFSLLNYSLIAVYRSFVHISSRWHIVYVVCNLLGCCRDSFFVYPRHINPLFYPPPGSWNRCKSQYGENSVGSSVTIGRFHRVSTDRLYTCVVQRC